MRGKIINAFKSRDDKVLANEEVRSMISAIGSGIGDEVDLTKRRYNKIVIMTDADIDGSHIRTLLLTFFYRQMYQLVTAGHVYVAQPPLFRVKAKKETYYVQTEEEMKTPAAWKRASARPCSSRATAARSRAPRWPSSAARVAALEESIIALERRGISLQLHALRQDPASGRLPVYHVFLGAQGTLVHHHARSSTRSSPSRKQADGQGADDRETSPPRTGQRRRRQRRTPTASSPAAHRRAARSAFDEQGPGRPGKRWASTCNR